MEPLLKGGGGGGDVQFNRDTALSVFPSNVKACRFFGQDLLRSQRLTYFPIKAYHETTKVKGNRLPRHQRHQRGGEGRGGESRENEKDNCRGKRSFHALAW